MKGPSLADFILRAEAIKLYREAMRACSRLHARDRDDMRSFIRAEFRSRPLTRMALSQGRGQLRDLLKSLSLAGAAHMNGRR